MKLRLFRLVSQALIYAAVAFTGLVLTSPEAGAKTMKCYRASDDQDHDGYARIGAELVDVHADDSALKCPGSYIDKGSDCNDFNAAVHPRTREIGYDGIDNNCNGLIDEPIAEYRDDGVNNDAHSFIISVHLNNTRIRDAARAGRLWVKVKYFPMQDATSLSTEGPFQVTQLGPFSNTAQFHIHAVQPGTVYVTRPYFYELPAGSSHLVRLSPAHNANAATDPGDVDMERYYTMTDSNVLYIHRRFLMIMRALNEVEASDWGEVGYTGTLEHDGLRYGASRNEKWCTEFYVWAIRPWVEGVTGIGSWDDMLEYFEDHHAKYAATEIPTALPGDYLALDSDRNGSINHSAMFLAYDPSGPTVWTLEGNSRNTVQVRNDRPADWSGPLPPGEDDRVMRRLGKIRSAMWR